jgi:hypothetical protein
MELMRDHLDQVASRALVQHAKPRGRDLMDILAPYAGQGPHTAPSLPETARPVRGRPRRATAPQ